MSSDDYLGTAISVTVVDDAYRHDYKHGPWGQLLAWSPQTQSYGIEVRPQRPPLHLQRMAPIPERDSLLEVVRKHGCGHPAERKYVVVRNGRDVVRCTDCQSAWSKRYRGRKKAA